MPDELETALKPQAATADRPLLGLTVLLVEDSRFASEAVRLMCLRSGARVRRADSLRSARRHLSVYRPTIAIIDLGLPDGSGAGLISDLAGAQPRVGAIFGTSGNPQAEMAARTAGADGFLPKPTRNLASFQQTLISHLPQEMRPVGPYLAKQMETAPDPLALREDLAHISDILGSADGDDRTTRYVAQFLSSLGRATGDCALEAAASRLEACRASGGPIGSELACMAGLVLERLSRLPEP